MIAITEQANQWKGGEASYCAELVRTGGNADVPRTAVESYLDLQRFDAQRDAHTAERKGRATDAAVAWAAFDAIDALHSAWWRAD